MSQVYKTVSSTPSVATSYVTNSGTAVPAANVLNILGAAQAAGAIPVETTGSGNTVNVLVQTSQAISSTDSTKIGLAAFNSAEFSVDSNGFVSLVSGGFKWIDQGTSTTIAAQNGYFVTAVVTLTLPASPSQGDTIEIIVDNSTASACTIQASGSQEIRSGSMLSAPGGKAVNSVQGDAIELIYRASDNVWIALNTFGTWTIT